MTDKRILLIVKRRSAKLVLEQMSLINTLFDSQGVGRSWLG